MPCEGRLKSDKTRVNFQDLKMADQEKNKDWKSRLENYGPQMKMTDPVHKSWQITLLLWIEATGRVKKEPALSRVLLSTSNAREQWLWKCAWRRCEFEYRSNVCHSAMYVSFEVVIIILAQPQVSVVRAMGHSLRCVLCRFWRRQWRRRWY